MQTCCTAYQRLVMSRHRYFITLCLVQSPEVVVSTAQSEPHGKVNGHYQDTM